MMQDLDNSICIFGNGEFPKVADDRHNHFDKTRIQLSLRKTTKPLVRPVTYLRDILFEYFSCCSYCYFYEGEMVLVCF